MLALAMTLVLAAPGGPPLAGVPPLPPEQAASPVTSESLPFFDLQRLRLSVGGSLSHAVLANPGGNSLGLGLSAALVEPQSEVALSLYLHGGRPAADERGRNTGPATSYLRAVWRGAPFPGELRVLFEGGAQVGWDRAFSWCAAQPNGADACGYSPSRLSWAAVAGTVVSWRPAGRAALTAGLDLLWRGPRPPAAKEGGPAQVWPLPLALQLWTEVGWGGPAS